MNDTAIARLARFNVQTRFEELPPALVERAKRHILDTFGATLAGSAALSSRQVLGVLAADAGAACTPVWGTSALLGLRDAAFANGVAAHALELDDSGGCDHSGAVVLPAAIAALCATERAVSGRELITAVVLGYELGRRVLEACGGYSPHNGRGWHSTATCGSFGAAAAAARVLGLDAEQTAAAFGHAASFSGGLWAFIHDASQTKRLHAGRAAEGGLTACLMARAGLSGPSRVFEDVWGGFFNAFAGETKQPEALLAGLGEVWKLMRCSIKPHASCRSTHAAIDAVLHLMHAHDGLAQRVRRIEVRASAFVTGMCGGRDLSTLASAQMSMAYAVAVAWVFGDARLERYLETVRGDARLAAAMKLVVVEADPAQAALDEPVITVHGEGMAPVSHHVPVALGAPANPLADAALLDKFNGLAALALEGGQAHTLADRVLDLDGQDDARRLLPLLSGQAERHAALC
jgi:2-methylcitrate dehydratase PrpD